MSTQVVEHEEAEYLAVVERQARRRRRLIAGLVAIVCLVVLGTAMALAPAAEGHGTHTQLGMPECSWVGRFDIPCPTCGMTTSFAHAVRGEFRAAFIAQPAGFLLSILTASAVFLSLYVMATGAGLGLERLLTGRLLWLSVCALLGAWGYKILTFREIL